MLNCQFGAQCLAMLPDARRRHGPGRFRLGTSRARVTVRLCAKRFLGILQNLSRIEHSMWQHLVQSILHLVPCFAALCLRETYHSPGRVFGYQGLWERSAGIQGRELHHHGGFRRRFGVKHGNQQFAPCPPLTPASHSSPKSKTFPKPDLTITPVRHIFVDETTPAKNVAQALARRHVVRASITHSEYSHQCVLS